MKPTTVAILAGTAALTLIYLAHQAAKGGSTLIRTIGDQVDPTNPENIAYSGINKVGSVLASDPSGNWTLGGWLYEATHEEYDPNRATAPTDPHTFTW